MEQNELLNNKILIAFDSGVLRSVLRKIFEDDGFIISEAEDGLEAVEKILTEQPNCVLIYVDLPVINAFAFTRIIKNSNTCRNTEIVACSFDNKRKYAFWMENTGNAFYYQIKNDQLGGLVSQVHKILEEKKTDVPPSSGTPPTREKIAELVTSSYDRELYELYIIRNAYRVQQATMETEARIEEMAKLLKHIYPYDTLAIIIESGTVIERYYRDDTLQPKEFLDFVKISRADFEKTVPGLMDYGWVKNLRTRTKTFKSGEASLVNAKIRFYDSFPIDKTKKTKVTLHIAKCSTSEINIRTRERIDFFTTIFTPLVEKAIIFENARNYEHKVRKAFSRFLPEKIIDDIITKNTVSASSTGERRKVAILIADIRSFTTISEKNAPENIVDFLNYYFGVMGKIIKKHGGTIDKFMGDAIMALFGAPESYTYNGCRAANAALEMIDALKTIDTSMLKMGDLSFNIGIGIHYGKPIVGSIGSNEKREYTVIGDDVNLASRMEGLTKQYGMSLLITDSVKKDIDAVLECEKAGTLPKDEEPVIPHITRRIDNVKVKGKSKAVSIYGITTDTAVYSDSFLEKYEKGLNQYEIGNFLTASEYFTEAAEQVPDDTSTSLLLSRCRQFIVKKPENWDGAISLTRK